MVAYARQHVDVTIHRFSLLGVFFWVIARELHTLCVLYVYK
jgi:hypothetical protein